MITVKTMAIIIKLSCLSLVVINTRIGLLEDIIPLSLSRENRDRQEVVSLCIITVEWTLFPGNCNGEYSELPFDKMTATYPPGFFGYIIVTAVLLKYFTLTPLLPAAVLREMPAEIKINIVIFTVI